MPNNPPTFRYPFALSGESEEVRRAHLFAFNKLLDLDRAVVSLKGQVDTTKGSSGTSSASSSSSGGSSTTVTNITNNNIGSFAVSAFNALKGSVTYFPNLGIVNNQTGVTAYTTQTSDGGAFVVLDDASPIAVTLNYAVGTPWYTWLANFGAGTATLTPGNVPAGSTSTITYPGNIGASSMPLPSGYAAYMEFDGKNFWAVAIAINSSVTGVTSLDGITGAITLVAGSGVSITDNAPSPGDITIAATGAAGVSSLNTLTGALSLTSTSATITITPSGSTINLDVTGGFLPVNNPTFTGIITGPRYAANGSTPSAAPGAQAGAGASASITGNDTRGNVSVTYGTSATGGDAVDVTFTAAFANPPYVQVVPTNSNASGIGTWYVTATINGFSIHATGNGAPATTVSFNYWCIE